MRKNDEKATALIDRYLFKDPNDGKYFLLGPYYRSKNAKAAEELEALANGIGGKIGKLTSLKLVMLSYREWRIIDTLGKEAACKIVNEFYGQPSNRSLTLADKDKGRNKRLIDYVPEIQDFLRYGRLPSPEGGVRYIIAFLDFKNSTDLLDSTATCFFRSLQNKLLSRLSEVITRPASGDEAIRGFIDKFAGDNIMFYFRVPMSEETKVSKDRFKDVFLRLQDLLYTFCKEIDEFGMPLKDKPGRPLPATCPGCTRCAKDLDGGMFHDFKARFDQMKDALGVRIGAVLTEKPIYLSVLGLAVEDHDRAETDYTFTGEDVNLAARLESLKDETMLADLDRTRLELERYRSKLYDARNLEQTAIMRAREDINVCVDDIRHIAGARLSIRVNKALYKHLIEADSSCGPWRKVKFIPKGFSQAESVFALTGRRCRKIADQRYELI